MRPLGLRLYTTNLADDDATIIQRNRWRIVGLLVPNAIISERTNLTFQPTAAGTVFLVGSTTYARDLPGLKIRVAKGPPPLEGDFPYVDGLFIASRPRALLESLKHPARPRGGGARSLTKAEIEGELEKILATDCRKPSAFCSAPAPASRPPQRPGHGSPVHHTTWIASRCSRRSSRGCACMRFRNALWWPSLPSHLQT